MLAVDCSHGYVGGSGGIGMLESILVGFISADKSSFDSTSLRYFCW